MDMRIYTKHMRFLCSSVYISFHAIIDFKHVILQSSVYNHFYMRFHFYCMRFVSYLVFVM
ncbi:hypothetical protein Hanom_Chr15g01402761 [Helianthus anomalus]